MSKNIITVHNDKIEIKNQNNEIIYYDNSTDIYNVITPGGTNSLILNNIPIPFSNIFPLSNSLLHLSLQLSKGNNFIIVCIRNPIERNLSYFYNIGNNPYKTYHPKFETKKNNYQTQIINFSEKIINKSTNDTINLYFNTDIHSQFNEWFSEFFEITGINQKTFNKTDGLDFYELPNNNKIMIYTYEKFDNNLSIFNKILRQNIITNINDIQEEYKEHYNNTKSQITYTQSYLDSQLNTDIMKFFYSDEDIQSFYNKYTILN
jgi:hypothetical protein